MAKCEGATFARSLAFMPLINQDYLSPSLAKARPLRPPRGSCVYAYYVRCPPLPTVATLPYIAESGSESPPPSGQNGDNRF